MNFKTKQNSARTSTWRGFLLPTAHRPLLTVCCLLPSAFCLLFFVALALAQRPRNNFPGQPRIYEVPQNQADLSGRFIYARIRFDTGLAYGGRHIGDGGQPWSHDYPEAGRHLMKIISELSKTDATLDQNEPIFAFDDPHLFKYPLAYLCEVGAMNLSDKEIAGMREYCLRGGFLLVDDFRGEDFDIFVEHAKRAFPEYELKEMDVSHAIFNCFFSIESLNTRSYGRYTPRFYGLEDNTGRLMMIVNRDNDISDYWQWSDDPFRPLEETNQAYKFGVNYSIYALTH
ncbi:MAG: DUF4159 domain-containing protein [Pyrinomonadaceae bacterium]|nr:DUF4159 domain-containing protein [Pyrinomonadaceae bacterium]